MRGTVLLATLTLLVGPVACSSSDPSPTADLGAVVEDRLADAAYDEVRAVLVDVDGETVVEVYQGSEAGEHHTVFSVTKSVSATLVGVAVDDGLLAVDDRLADLLPAYADRMAPWQADATLGQLLTHTAGFAGENFALELEVSAAADPVAAALAVEGEPAEFEYSNLGTALLAPILVEATGESLLEFARSRLFDPVGIDTEPVIETPVGTDTPPEVIDAYQSGGFGWGVDATGVHNSYAFLRLTPTDLVRLGRLWLAEGGDVVSAGWMGEATSVQVDRPGSGTATGYGYLFWLNEVAGHPAYAAVGYGGQLVQVVPDLDLVVAVATEVDLNDPASVGVSWGTIDVLVSEVVEGLG